MKIKFAPAFLFVVLACVLAGCGFFVPSKHDPAQYGPAQAAAEGGDLVTLKQLVKADPSLIHTNEWGSLTLLHLAVLHNQTSTVDYLVTQGSDIKAKTDKGITPIHEAAQNGNQDIMEILLAHGADINALDDQKQTPLDRALWSHAEVADFIKQKGGHAGNGGQ